MIPTPTQDKPSVFINKIRKEIEAKYNAMLQHAPTETSVLKIC